jgi:hypothetical protein
MKLHFFHQLVALIALTALRIRIHRGANFGHRKGPGIGVQRTEETGAKQW